jgi:sugar/nucleoside kinase (ribokinase family)
MDSLVVGCIGLDNITIRDTHISSTVGGAAVYASLSSVLFSPTKILSVVGADFPEIFLNRLSNRAIDLRFLQRSKKPSFRWNGHYATDFDDMQVTHQQMNAAQDLDVETVIEASKTCKSVFLASNDTTIQLRTISSLSRDTIKLVDSAAIFMVEKRDVLLQTLKSTDVYFLGEKESKYIGENNQDLNKVVDKILSNGTKVVVVKKGQYGLSVYGNFGTFVLPSYPLAKVVDPTGAGDVLGGAFTGILAKFENIDREVLMTAAVVGTVTSSFVIEGFGVEPMMNIKAKMVLDRTAKFLQMLPQCNKLLIHDLMSI